MGTSSSSSNTNERSEHFLLTGIIKGTKKKEPTMKINFSVNENERPQNLPQVDKFKEEKKKSFNYSNENYRQSYNNPQTKNHLSNENKQRNNH